MLKVKAFELSSWRFMNSLILKSKTWGNRAAQVCCPHVCLFWVFSLKSFVTLLKFYVCNFYFLLWCYCILTLFQVAAPCYPLSLLIFLFLFLIFSLFVPLSSDLFLLSVTVLVLCLLFCVFLWLLWHLLHNVSHFCCFICLYMPCFQQF